MGEGGAVSRIKAKLDSRGHFVHILPARPRSPDEFFLDIDLVNRDGTGYVDHPLSLHQIAGLCNFRPGAAK